MIIPDYLKNKLKAPVTKPMYDLMGLDLILLHTNATTVKDYFKLPSEKVEETLGHPHVPSWIVFNVNIPSEEPSLLSLH